MKHDGQFVHFGACEAGVRCVAVMVSCWKVEELLFALYCVAEILVQLENTVLVYLVCLDNLV